MQSTQVLGRAFSDGRQVRLLRELRAAWSAAPGDQLAGWLGDVTRTLGRVTFRRARNIGRLAKTVTLAAISETIEAVQAHGKGRLGRHLQEKGSRVSKSLKGGLDRASHDLTVLKTAIQKNPTETLPRAIVGALAFVAASGGADANGGVPDLDLKLGIDAHRNVFFHSFFAGVVLETLLYATATGIGILYRHLPREHDPIWDAIARNKDAYLQAAAAGGSAGIAYHLFVDATVQPGAYHGLPISMPLEAHQAALAGNAATEALDVARKRETFRTSAPARPAARKSNGPRREGLSVQSASVPGVAEAKVQPSGNNAVAGERVSPTTDEEERRRHLALLKTPLRIDDRIASDLSARDRAIVIKYGRWLKAIDEGFVRPIAPDQMHFIDVCRGRTPPKSEMEIAWVRYRVLRAKPRSLK